jgi:hypothetical protein
MNVQKISYKASTGNKSSFLKRIMLYDWCEECMNLSALYGFWGSTPWNFSHPYWNNWSNIDWYKQVNSNFLTL